MSALPNGFHHVGLITRDLDKTITAYERLGFTFTPLSMPRIILSPGQAPQPFGAGNRTAIFEDNYLEILAHTDMAAWNATTPKQRGPYDIDRPLSRYEGLHVMHFNSDDVAALRNRLVDEGVDCTQITDFERGVDTADGPRTMRAVAFAFPPGANPEGLIQVAQHLTPELVLQPRFMHHANGARTITETIVSASDPDAYAQKYQYYTGHTAVLREHVWRVDVGASSRIIVVPPERVSDVVPGATAPADPSLVGFTIAVADIERTTRLLRERSVPFVERDGRLIVGPDHGCGSAVIFTPGSRQRSP